MINYAKEMEQQAFAKYAITETPQPALYIEWEDLADLFTDLLREILGRLDITAGAAREEYYYWKIPLETPISQSELERIFDLVVASDWDRQETAYEEGFPIMELGEGLCKKLINKLLPFDLLSTRADDEGVWFIGKTKH